MPLQDAHRQLIQQSSKDAASYETLLALVEDIQRASDNRYNQIAENVPGMIYRFRTQPNGHVRFEYVNQRCMDLNGVPPEAILENPGILVDQILPEDRESYYVVARNAALSGQPFYWEGRALINGEIRWRRLEAQAEQEANGDVIWHGIQIDTTLQRRAEESLRASEARLRLITDNMLDLICLTDENLVIDYASPSHQAILGYPPEMLVGKPVFELVHPEDLKELRDKAQQSIADGYIGKAIFRYCHRDGHYLWLETTGSLLYAADGQFIGVVFSSRDTTERHQMETALRESEARFQALVNSSDDLIFTLDHEQRYTGIYGRAQPDIFPEGAPGKTAAELFDTATAVVHEQANRQALAGQNTRYQWQSGNTYYETSVSPMLNHAHETLGVVGIGRDITRLKHLEQELREQQTFIENITNTVPDLIYVYDLIEGRNIYVNHSSAHILGYPPDEIKAMGSQLAERLMHPEDRKKRHQTVITLPHTQEPMYDSECRFRHANGEWRWLRLRETTFQREPDGRKRLILGIAQDITVNKQIEQALKESELRYREMIENAPAAILITNLETQEVLYRNPVAVSMDYPVVYADLSPKEQAVSPVEYSFVARDGEVVYFTVQSIPMVYQGTNAVMSVLMDITERKHMEQTLLESERLKTMLQTVEALNQFKSKMMLHISHEFRTPLAVIQLASESINRYAMRMTLEKRQELAYRISAQIQHLVNMLDEISFIVHHQSQPVTPKWTTFEINQLCLEMMNRIRTVMNIECPIEFVASERYTVTADAKLIKILLTSLLSNAVKFSPQASSVLLNLREVDSELDLRVIDQGIGISEQDQQHIFEAFYRGSNISEISGMGLGLSIAQEIVKAHGGSINVESTMNGGTIFSIRLPILAK